MAKSHKSIVASIAHRPFPELAAALRSQTEKIIEMSMASVRSAVPSATDLPDNELRDHLPVILAKMADVMESASRHDVDELIENAPAQGLARFQQQYDVRELMTEERLLRRVIIEQVEMALGHRMIQAERVALDMSIDTMLQEAVVAFITQQHERLRAAADAELKYLSFLSHDLKNNLGSITMLLQGLRQQLGSSKKFERHIKTLNAAQQSILDTIGGMERLLQSERLRKAEVKPVTRPVRLHELASNVTMTLAKEAEAKGVRIDVEIPADVVINSDGELIGLIIQNLLGNAVKYSSKGTILVRAVVKAGACVMSVSDEGSGIPVEHMDRIFDSFRRGEAHDQPGIGLGLTIALQAARLLNAKLSFESKVGIGSTFFVTLPLLS